MPTATLTASAFEARAEELRAYSPSRRGAKQERTRLVREHGDFLAQFAIGALKELSLIHI